MTRKVGVLVGGYVLFLKNLLIRLSYIIWVSRVRLSLGREVVFLKDYIEPFEAVDFFQDLYGDVSEPMSDLPTNSCSLLVVSNIEFFGKEVSNEEIKKALFDLAHLKAP
ncbi:hypothetical protein Goshw_022949, partial [Gossypium schwendimanii]|nr:hypothetical protein [Gossypium schwendimanii]